MDTVQITVHNPAVHYAAVHNSVRYFFLNKGSSSRVFLYIYTKVLLAHVMDSTVACPVKGDGGGGGGGVQGQRALHLPPPLHAAPVGGGGHLQLAVGGPARRQAVQAAAGETVLGQVAGRAGPARLAGLGGAGPARQVGGGSPGPARLAAGPGGLVREWVVGRREDDGQAQLLGL